MMKLRFPSSLRLRFAMSVALPVLLVFGGLSLFQYFQDMQLIRAQMQTEAEYAGDILNATLQHAMLIHDETMLGKSIESTIGVHGIERVRVLDGNSVVRADSLAAGLGTKLDPANAECAGCHRYPEGERPRTLLVNNAAEEQFRVATAVENRPECTPCHDASKKTLGVLLIEVSAREQQQQAQVRVLRGLGITLVITALLSGFVFLRMNQLVSQRLASFKKPLQQYEAGDFATRLPVSHRQDELDQLAGTFNHMIGVMEHYVEREKQRGQLFQKKIIEERERIARELHDSLPQLLAYFNTKMGAIALLVQNDKKDTALENLSQLEDASRRMLTDVRDAIIGLRSSRLLSDGLEAALQEYIEQFCQLCSKQVDFSYAPELGSDTIAPEIQIQALRIVQEALSNVRKYANAKHIRVQLAKSGENMLITITDDGIGFAPGQKNADGGAHYGLATMRERAELHGGAFVIESHPGMGTTITVTMPITLPEEE